MAEKKTQENPVPEGSYSETMEKSEKDAPKQTTKVTPPPIVPIQVPRFSIPSFTKTPPNELYRKLLPAILFILTFVTVMTMLLIYMDTFALAAQQFRQNMTQDKELARISAESPTLVAYVKQLHVAPRPPRTPPTLVPTERVAVLDKILGENYNGTLIEVFPRGPRDPTAQYLETVRGWSSVAVRAAPRDFLALRGDARALHACLSPGEHPRSVSYEEADGAGGVFRTRVLCLPLLTVLLAAHAQPPALLSLAGRAAPAALRTLPFAALHLKVIDFRSTDPVALNRTSQLLETNNYTVAATFDDGIMFSLNNL